MIGRHGISLGLLALAGALAATGCSKFEIQDVDPADKGVVRTLGPESGDLLGVAESMVASLLASPRVQQITAGPEPPTVAMLPMVNNTRYPFNQAIFSSRVETRLINSGKFNFVARDLMADVSAERVLKRDGEVDYDPSLRTPAMAGVDYFIIGRCDGLTAVSKKGQAETLQYSFKLVNAETGLILWKDDFTVKREGKDDLIHR
jgi:PBP1b-binding outer membrane lipoprotein LpoB